MNKMTLRALDIEPALIHDGFRARHPYIVASKFAEAGHRVFPVRGKQPLCKWREEATTCLGTLARWQKFWSPDWAICTGRENGLFILDVDGEQGRADLARLEAKLGPLPHTPRVNSGREDGGEHIWLAFPEGDGDVRNQQPIVVDGVRFKIDVRGWGGYAVLPGSRHKSGRRYQWCPEHARDEIEVAVPPEAWWDFLPKKEFATTGGSRSRTSTPSARRGSPVKRKHDPASYLIGDGRGFGGFQDPVFKNAIRYFLKAGGDAPAEPIVACLQELIAAAPKDHGRDVSRYLSGPDLPRLIERARKFVKENVSEKS